MRTVQLYINNERVDLFNDEKIQVSLTTQNISDIAKVWTDFSQTFTVPCSEQNNDIFDYFYNNDYDGTYQANDRADARIEINHIPFRRGQVQLEGAVLKDGVPEAYKITFYGDVVTLKDLFGEDKLRDLDYSGVNFDRSGANVEDTIDGTTVGDVMFPLITSDRAWTYGDAAATDISVAGNAISYTELFPALAVSRIFSIIQTDYGITFNGNFLTDDRFTKLYTWWKNKDQPSFTSEPVAIQFNAANLSCNSDVPSAVGVDTVNYDYINPQTLTQPGDWQSWVTTSPNASFHRMQIMINSTTSDQYYVDVFRNGVGVQTLVGSGGGVVPATGQYFQATPNDPGLDDVYTFQFRSDAAITVDGTIVYQLTQNYVSTDVGNPIKTAYFECNFPITSMTTTTNIDFSSSAPDIKVVDFFSGVLKMFNLTCYPSADASNFQIEPLPDWYDGGQIIDITEFVDLDEIKVDRAKLYNEISFEWQDSKSFMNTRYEGNNARKWGNLTEYFGYDGGDYKIKLPFENFLFSNPDNQAAAEDLIVGYSLDEELKPFTPKPVMLYRYDATTCDFYHNDGSTNNQITSYIPFGTEALIATEDYSINFNEELSPLSNIGVTNSLYNIYYRPYLVNLFNPKTRIVTVKCHLPLELLTYITLDDAILIRDKQYRINEMKCDLTSGDVELVLISDWIPTYRRIPAPPQVPQTGGTIVVPVKPVKPKKGGKVTVSVLGTPFTTSSETLPYDFTDDGSLTITVPTNSTGSDRLDTYKFEYYLPDGTLYKTEYVSIDQKASYDELLKEDGDFLLQESLYKIRLE